MIRKQSDPPTKVRSRQQRKTLGTESSAQHQIPMLMLRVGPECHMMTKSRTSCTLDEPDTSVAQALTCVEESLKDLSRQYSLPISEDSSPGWCKLLLWV